jgi:glutamate-1-semialdehyde 2,1-aminomutase
VLGVHGVRVSFSASGSEPKRVGRKAEPQRERSEPQHAHQRAHLATAPRQPRCQTMRIGPKSRRQFTRSQKVIPGGVNSPVRAFKRLGGQPPVIDHGEGAWLVDVDGRRYVDYVCSWGPLILGHAHPKVVNAITKAAKRGISFGAPTVGETDLAEILCKAIPGMDRVRLVNSGTEATMSALRVARAATGRDLVLKFDGCYHGHADHLLVSAGSGLATLGTPDSSGVPADFAKHTASLPYNDLAAVERFAKKHRRELAAIIVEPVAGNMGLVLPKPGFLEGLRAICDRIGALLIFDEVMTGFRVGWGGWSRISGITPDLTCLGKVIGAGTPLAAYGGSRAVMAHLAPEGSCYQAGTLSGNPLAVAAGLAQLAQIAKPGFHDRLSGRLTKLISGLRDRAAKAGVAVQFAQAGTMWGFFFGDQPVTDFTSAAASDTNTWAQFAAAMLDQGVYLAPSPFEAAFISAAHGPRELAHTWKAAEVAFAACG